MCLCWVYVHEETSYEDHYRTCEKKMGGLLEALSVVGKRSHPDLFLPLTHRIMGNIPAGVERANTFHQNNAAVFDVEEILVLQRASDVFDF